jgi:hypothetical protein
MNVTSPRERPTIRPAYDESHADKRVLLRVAVLGVLVTQINFTSLLINWRESEGCDSVCHGNDQHCIVSLEAYPSRLIVL